MLVNKHKIVYKCTDTTCIYFTCFCINFIYQVYKRAVMMGQLELVTIIPIKKHMHLESLQMERIS